MKVEIICKDYHLDDQTRAVIEKKLTKFDKYFDTGAKAKVKLSTVAVNNYIMEVTVSEGAMIIRAIAESDRMSGNIDLVLPKLEKQILKHREKFIAKCQKGAFETPAIYTESEKTEDVKKPKIVKVKKFSVSVTTVENAAEEMELLAHDFYVFVNGETNKICVLYKRNDGDLGLIEPEY